MTLFQRPGAKLTFYPEAPDWNGRTMAVAKQKFESVAAGTALLEEIIVHARNAGAKALIGPMEGDTWHTYRLITETSNRPPFLMEPVSEEYDLAAFQAAGFETIASYFSADVHLDRLGDQLNNPPGGLKVAHWDGEDPEALFVEVHRLSHKAFSKNPFFKPLDLDVFLGMYMPLVPLLRPELILFARDHDNALQGFLFGVPNYAEGPKPAATILKTYASLKKGAGHQLSTQFYRASLALGYQTVIHALIHDDNLSALRSAANGAHTFRRYALMGRRLDD